MNSREPAVTVLATVYNGQARAASLRGRRGAAALLRVRARLLSRAGAQ